MAGEWCSGVVKLCSTLVQVPEPMNIIILKENEMRWNTLEISMSLGYLRCAGLVCTWSLVHILCMRVEEKDVYAHILCTQVHGRVLQTQTQHLGVRLGRH